MRTGHSRNDDKRHEERPLNGRVAELEGLDERTRPDGQRGTVEAYSTVKIMSSKRFANKRCAGWLSEAATKEIVVLLLVCSFHHPRFHSW